MLYIPHTYLLSVSVLFSSPYFYTPIYRSLESYSGPLPACLITPRADTGHVTGDSRTRGRGSGHLLFSIPSPTIYIAIEFKMVKQVAGSKVLLLGSGFGTFFLG